MERLWDNTQSLLRYNVEAAKNHLGADRPNLNTKETYARINNGRPTNRKDTVRKIDISE